MVGFDWPDVEGIFAKLGEEAEELKESLTNSGRAHQEDEIGDLLFVCVNLARFLGFDAEIALKKANRKFTARFREMEQIASDEGKAFNSRDTADMEKLWKKAKAIVRNT